MNFITRAAHFEKVDQKGSYSFWTWNDKEGILWYLQRIAKFLIYVQNIFRRKYTETVLAKVKVLLGF